jgi:hypothetical protein
LGLAEQSRRVRGKVERTYTASDASTEEDGVDDGLCQPEDPKGQERLTHHGRHSSADDWRIGNMGKICRVRRVVEWIMKCWEEEETEGNVP